MTPVAMGDSGQGSRTSKTILILFLQAAYIPGIPIVKGELVAYTIFAFTDEDLKLDKRANRKNEIILLG